MKLSRPSASLVVAVLALVVALGGVSYAAITLPKNSVGTPQLKKAAVTTKKIKRNAVTSAKVRADTLTGADIDESTLMATARSKAYASHAFHPETSDNAYDVTSNLLHRTGGLGSDGFIARLDLPQGATIGAVRVYVRDDIVDQAATAFLRRVDVRTGSFQNLAIGFSTTDSVIVLPFTLIKQNVSQVVDNTVYDYELEVLLNDASTSAALAGAVVEYSAAPLE